MRFLMQQHEPKMRPIGRIGPIGPIIGRIGPIGLIGPILNGKRLHRRLKA